MCVGVSKHFLSVAPACSKAKISNPSVLEADISSMCTCVLITLNVQSGAYQPQDQKDIDLVGLASPCRRLTALVMESLPLTSCSSSSNVHCYQAFLDTWGCVYPFASTDKRLLILFRFRILRFDNRVRPSIICSQFIDVIIATGSKVYSERRTYVN